MKVKIEYPNLCMVLLLMLTVLKCVYNFVRVSDFTYERFTNAMDLKWEKIKTLVYVVDYVLLS